MSAKRQNKICTEGISLRGMRTMPAVEAAESSSKLSAFIAELPFWAQTLISIAVIIVVAAIAGMIVGKLYAMVKYPDPDSNSPVSPKIKVAFICLLALCCWWFFSTAMDQHKAKATPYGEQIGMEAPAGNYGIMVDDIAIG